MAEDGIKQTIAEIKEKADIVGYLQGMGYQLTPSGNLRYRMLCPFHQEKTPSCMVYAATNTWHCFGCGKGGDLIEFVKDRGNLQFMDAIEQLADQYHVEVRRDAKDVERTNDITRLRNVCRDAWAVFKHLYDQLPEDHPAKLQVSKRNIPTENSKNHDLFGYAPKSSSVVIGYMTRKFKWTEQDLIDAGIAKRSERGGDVYIRWRDRLMFPIRDIIGRPLGFTGRRLDGEKTGKYVNSPTNELYKKDRVLFCADIAKNQASHDKEVFVVEGQFDVIAMQHIGKDNTVASSGTAFSTYQVNMLRRFVGPTGRIVFAFDADAAGQKAARETFINIGPLQPQAWATITKDKDASDMYRDDPESLKRQASTIMALWSHVLGNLCADYDATDMTQRLAFIEECKRVYGSITDPQMADSFLTEAAARSGLKLNVMRAQLGAPENVNSEGKPDGVIMVPKEEAAGGRVEQTLDRILSLADETPEIRKDIADIDFGRGVRDSYAKMLMNTDKPIILETLDPLSQRYVEHIRRMAPSLHRFDKFVAAESSPEELLAQQKAVLGKLRRTIRIEGFITRNSGKVRDSTNDDLLGSYQRQIRKLAGTRVDDDGTPMP